MRKIFYVLVPLIALSSLRQAQAVIIDATAIAHNTSMSVFEDTSGQNVYFRQANDVGSNQNVVITNVNSIEGGGPTYSGGNEFGLSVAPAFNTSLPVPVADIWWRLQLESDLDEFDGSDDIERAMLDVTQENRQTILRVDFENTVSNVSVGFVVFGNPPAYNDPLNLDGNNATFGFYAFDSDGVLLGRVTSTNDLSPDQFPVLTSTFVGVKTLLVGSDFGQVPTGIQFFSYDIDESELPVVPEPASAALALFGLAGAFFGRRRLMAAE